MTDRNEPLSVLEEKTAVLFLVAGAMMLVFAVNTYLKTFTGTSYPVVQGVVAPVGFLVGVVGLFGLYPGLADQSPKLARAAGVATAVTAVGWVVIIVMSIVSRGEPGGPLAVVPLATIVAMVLVFALFGASSLRSPVHSRVVGVLLLVEAGMFLLVIAGVPGFLIDTGHVVAYLGLGMTLRVQGTPFRNTERVSDSTG